jgi:glycosyltransferase involved in cell wall biosynthesis
MASLRAQTGPAAAPAPQHAAAGMMHVLLLAPAIEDYCVEYANAVAGVARISLIAPARLFGDYAPFLDPAIDLHLVDWPRHSSPRNLVAAPRLARLIDRLRPDLVHVLAESVVWLNLVLLGTRRRGLVTTMHDVAYHLGDHASRRVPRRFANWLMARSDLVIVHGTALRAEAERAYPRLRQRLAVLPHLQLRRYLNIARKSRLRRRDDPTVNVLFFGRIYAYKGLDVLIRSIPAVLERFAQLRVTIAGEGEAIEQYTRLISHPPAFDIRNRRIGDDETAQLFTDADIVVLPYVEASQSGVLAIAQAFAKPVIVTDVGELGRSVDHGVTGLVVPARDAATLAEAILRLAGDDALRQRLGQAGCAAATAAAAPEHVAAAAGAIYRRVIAQRVIAGRAGPAPAEPA